MTIHSYQALPREFLHDHYCLVAAGVSLDACSAQIEQLLKEEIVFILSDIIAFSFIKKYPQSKRLIITVEYRPHNYLKKLKHEHIFFYRSGRRDNLTASNFCYPFILMGEKLSAWQELALVSPGTVGGLSLSLAFYLLLFHPHKTRGQQKISLLGLDFSYAHARLFSRYVQVHLSFSRLYSRELYELEAVYKKTSHWQMSKGQLLRSSAEFILAAQNCTRLLETAPAEIELIDFSPWGISSQRLKKSTCSCKQTT